MWIGISTPEDTSSPPPHKKIIIKNNKYSAYLHEIHNRPTDFSFVCVATYIYYKQLTTYMTKIFIALKKT